MPATPPMLDGDTGIDVEATLSELWRMAKASKNRATSFEESGLHVYEEKIKRAQKWGGWVWGLVGLIGAIFSAGVVYAVFMGENATDTEVKEALRKEMTAHNGGVHPDALDLDTHAPVGAHPDIRKQIEGVQSNMRTLKIQSDRMEVTQKKLDKRSQYQFELGRWEALSLEHERRGKRPPPKPDILRDLETDLMMGKYD